MVCFISTAYLRQVRNTLSTDVYIKNAVLLAAMRKNRQRIVGPCVIAFSGNRLVT